MSDLTQTQQRSLFFGSKFGNQLRIPLHKCSHGSRSGDGEEQAGTSDALLFLNILVALALSSTFISII
jgi:hypothetical protein